MKSVNVDISLVTINGDGIDCAINVEQARELLAQLGGLFGGTSEEIGLIDARLAYLEMRNSKAEAQEERLTGAPVKEGDTGRTVWATDGEGNPISPDELKARNRERSDKWADVGKKFAAEAKPDYYTDHEAGIWQEFKGTFEARWLKTGDNSFVMMNGNKVHSLCWGNPYKSYGIRQRWDCVNGFTE